MSAFVGVIVGLLQGLLSVFGFAQPAPTSPQLPPDIVINPAQQTVQQATNISVPNPTVSTNSSAFSASPTFGPAPLTVNFAVPAGPPPSPGEGMQGGIYYLLYFGDGQSTPTGNLEGKAFSGSHTYATPGIYIATLVSPGERGAAGDGTTVGSETITVTSGSNGANLSNPNMAGDACSLYGELKLGDTDASVGGDGMRVTEMQTFLGINPTTGTYGSRTQIAYTNKCVGGNASPTSVVGMSKYTDSDFGFSFWYPSGWNMEQEPDTNFTTAYPGGVVKKRWVLYSTIDSDHSMTIEEYYSPTASIRLNADSGCPGGICSPTLNYFFDASAHTWMMAYPNGFPSERGDGGIAVGTTLAADVSHNTMGGLHIFTGGFRGEQMLIPLSAHNFVIVSDQPWNVGPLFKTYLVQTILATDPSVATPASATEQVKTIQSEKDTYSSIQSHAPAGQ